MMYSAGVFVCLLAALAGAQPVTQGTLRVIKPQGAAALECPLKHTTMKASISGMAARVSVTQEFQNPASEKIEAVYTFPLPHQAAVDSMTMRMGGRTVRGKIKPREEAAALYEAAKQSGRAAALLDQERPNVFTQSVANVMPGEMIEVSITYVQILSYDSGIYEFVFPMVVGPRYIPAGVEDGSRIAPPVMAEGVRPGHDISIEVEIDAGRPIGKLESPSHEINLQWLSGRSANAQLRGQQTIPNKDFVLRFESATEKIEDITLAHRSAKGGFFTLILEPPAKVGPAEAAAKELIFVLDTSGSMSGFPIDKAKESMRLALDGLYPQDTFNLITFSGDTEILFPVSVAATSENVRMAKMFLETRSGQGGTEMMRAIRAALEPGVETGRVRIVCFMTDGYVGNDQEILAEIQKHPSTRVFSFGIGQSVNRFLLDGMARYGRGEVQYVGLKDDGSAAARRFHERVRNPLLTDVEIDWGGLAVTDVAPARIPDLFGAKPVVLTGRYEGPMRGTAMLRGKVGGQAVERRIAVDLPAAETGHEVLPALWARARVEDLMAKDYLGAQRGSMRADLKEEITQLGVEFGVMTQFTSFVAVEERMVTTEGKPRRVEVPVSLPEGVSEAAVPLRIKVGGNVSVAGGVAGGAPGGVLGGIVGGVPSAAPPPPAAFGHLVAPPLIPRQFDAGLGPRKLDAALEEMGGRAANAAVVVEVQILLLDVSAGTMEALRTLGFEATGTAGNGWMVVGRIAAGRLRDLAKVAAVRYVVKRG